MIGEDLARGGKRRVHQIKDTLKIRIKNLARWITPGSGLILIFTGTSRRRRGHAKKGVQKISQEDYPADSGV